MKNPGNFKVRLGTNNAINSFTFNQQGPMVVRTNFPPYSPQPEFTITASAEMWQVRTVLQVAGTSHPVYYLIVLLSMEYFTPPSQSELMMLLSTISPSW
jgi:hypothetical protein